eukprot:scaffold123204_cov33-Tisochrysis_lutea.AAC.6
MHLKLARSFYRGAPHDCNVAIDMLRCSPLTDILAQVLEQFCLWRVGHRVSRALVLRVANEGRIPHPGKHGELVHLLAQLPNQVIVQNPALVQALSKRQLSDVPATYCHLGELCEIGVALGEGANLRDAAEQVGLLRAAPVALPRQRALVGELRCHESHAVVAAQPDAEHTATVSGRGVEHGQLGARRSNP